MDIWDIFQEIKLSGLGSDVDHLRRTATYGEAKSFREKNYILKRIRSLEAEHDRLELIVLAISQTLQDEGLLDPEKLRKKIKTIDALDGKVDGKVTKKRGKEKTALKVSSKKKARKTIKLPKKSKKS